MNEMIELSEKYMRRIELHFALPNGAPLAEDRQIIRCSIYAIRNGRRRRDTPAAENLYQTVYNRFILSSRLGVLDTHPLRTVKRPGFPGGSYL